MFTETTSGILDLIPFSVIKETNLDLFTSQLGVLKQRPIPVFSHPFFFFFLFGGADHCMPGPQSRREKHPHVGLSPLTLNKAHPQ